MNASGIDKLKQAVAADPKRSGALAILAVLLIALIGRTIMQSGGKAVPATASAAKTAPSAGTGSKTAAGAAAFQPLVGVSAAMQKWSEQAVPPISRNIFAVRMEYFRVEGSRTPQSGQQDEGFWARLEKSMAQQADQKDKRENLIANYRAEAAKLRLQSTMMGSQPRAMVNGELVREGSVVASFRVERIEARRIIVEREGIRLEIQMN
jgi:hypothetical protein